MLALYYWWVCASSLSVAALCPNAAVPVLKIKLAIKHAQAFETA